ncbi:MAG: response regulator [Chloroflexi bacterium]|nr:MAG: response regulator [Chloroflexota bacterium]
MIETVNGDILIVDDTITSLNALLTILTNSGYEVRGAHNGATGLMIAQAEPPELVLLDVKMPDMDGYEVCRQLKQNPVTADIPVIFVSALDEVEDKVKGFEAGGVDFISKPYQLEEVLARVQIHLRLSKLQKQLEVQNDLLQDEVSERERAEAALRVMNDELEQRVGTRTAELAQANGQIQEYSENLEQLVANRTRELEVLYRVTAVASESLDLEISLRRSLEQILAAMHSSTGVIHLLNKKEQTLNLIVHQGVQAKVLEQISSLSAASPLAAQIMASGQPTIVPGLSHIPFLPPAPSADQRQTYIGMPLSSRGQQVGLMSFVREKELAHPSAEELALLNSVAEQIGLVVERAWLQQQAEQTAVMEERARLARDLHDSVTQLLYSATLIAEAGRESINSDNYERAHTCVIELGDISQQALKEMRLLIYELHPPKLERDGLLAALQERLDSVEGRTKIATQLLVDDLPELPIKMQETLYFIALEALNNTLKHAQAKSVALHIKVNNHDQQLCLHVTDDGVGFDPGNTAGKGGLGLKSMQARADKLGGTLTILSELGRGTAVKACLAFHPTIPDANKNGSKPH